MSRKLSTSALAQVRRERRELRRLMKKTSELVARNLREAIEAGWIKGRVEGDEVIIEDDAWPLPPPRRTR